MLHLRILIRFLRASHFRRICNLHVYGFRLRSAYQSFDDMTSVDICQLHYIILWWRMPPYNVMDIFFARRDWDEDAIYDFLFSQKFRPSLSLEKWENTTLWSWWKWPWIWRPTASDPPCCVLSGMAHNWHLTSNQSSSSSPLSLALSRVGHEHILHQGVVKSSRAHDIGSNQRVNMQSIVGNIALSLAF